jgi:hypothetical protein
VLLLALIALLIISAVAATLLYMTAGETSLVSNQRLAARAYTSGLGGLEEGRARLSTGDAGYIGNTDPADAIPDFTIPMPDAVGEVLYVLNPNPSGEFTLANITGTPCPSATNPYCDWEYNNEWGAGALAAATKTSVTSDMVSLDAALPSFPIMPYKWVRITVLTEQAARRDINGDAALDNTTVVTWDALTNKMMLGTNPDRLLVYRVTALSLVPMLAPLTGFTQKMVQYDVSGSTTNLAFPAAISLVGASSTCGLTNTCDCKPAAHPAGSYTCGGTDPVAPGSGNDANADGKQYCDSPTDFGPSNAMYAKGQDQSSPPSGGGPAIGCTDPLTCYDCRNELINFDRLSNWTGNDGTTGTATGDISGTIDPDLASTSGLLSTLQVFNGMADQVFSAGDPPPQQDGDATNDLVQPPGGDWATADLGQCDSTINHPVITVIDGDANLGSNGGCGVLVVTGRLTVQGAWSWKGVVIVVGEGYVDSSGGGDGGVEGAMLVARIYCQDGDPAPCPCTVGVPGTCDGAGVLNPPSGTTFKYNGGGTGDYNYNSAYIRNVFGNTKYQVLAYREISQ